MYHDEKFCIYSRDVVNHVSYELQQICLLFLVYQLLQCIYTCVYLPAVSVRVHAKLHCYKYCLYDIY